MGSSGSTRAQIGTLIIATSGVQLANGFFNTLISLRVAIESFEATMAGLVLNIYVAGFTLAALRCEPIIERVGGLRAPPLSTPGPQSCRMRCHRYPAHRRGQQQIRPKKEVGSPRASGYQSRGPLSTRPARRPARPRPTSGQEPEAVDDLGDEFALGVQIRTDKIEAISRRGRDQRPGGASWLVLNSGSA